MTSKNLVVNKTLIHYYAAAPQKRINGTPALVFLHGWRSEAAVWAPTMKELEKSYQCVSLDLPGFGKSPAPNTKWTLDDYCTTIAEFINKLNLTSVILIGHSFGGRIAIKLSKTQPKLITKLVLVDSAGIRDKKIHKNALQTLAKIIKPLFLPNFMRPLRKRIYQKLGSEDYIATPELKTTFVNVINEDLKHLLPKITHQTLILWGENDTETPLKHAHTIKENIPHARLIILPQAGHYSFLDQPKRFAQALLTFVEQ